MNYKKIGAVTIGQSPRPDLISPLRERLPADCQILQAGALDGLNAGSLPEASENSYPLVTRLHDGTHIMVEERYLSPRLQIALNRLEAQEVIASILLCAGTISKLQGTRPLLKPFNLGRELLNSLGIKAIGIISPVSEQEAPIKKRWELAGFQTRVWSADLSWQDETFHQKLDNWVKNNDCEAIVLDYVGHPVEQVAQLQASSPLPVFDLGQLALSTLAGIL